LRIPPDQVDGHRFLRRMRDARRVGSRGDTLDACTAALVAWTGAPGEPFADHPQLVVLRQERLVAGVLGIGAEHACGRVRCGCRCSPKLAAGAPLHEPLQAGLVESYRVTGQRAATLAAYDRTRRALRDELGIDPGRAVERDLFEARRRGFRTSPMIALDHVHTACQRDRVPPQQPDLASGTVAARHPHEEPVGPDRGLRELPAFLIHSDDRRWPFVALDPGFECRPQVEVPNVTAYGGHLRAGRHDEVWPFRVLRPAIIGACPHRHPAVDCGGGGGSPLSRASEVRLRRWLSCPVRTVPV
jgi:hypothetical protein